MLKNFSTPRGTNDILPDEAVSWQKLESRARRLLELYGYQEIRTPIFEETALFVRSLGQTTDVVQKQMLNLAAEKQDGFSLRPEGTAGVVRSYIEHSIDKKQGLAKFYYIGPMFRGERPQKGRLRQFHHIGVEAIGVSHPFLDAEIIALSVHLLTDFGLSGFKLKINSLGSSKDKEALSAILRKQLKAKLSQLCDDCQGRFERNVFRILDCKKENCKAVVAKLDRTDAHLSPESKAYFSQVQEALNSLNISFEISPFLARGLDYYTHTVFEISHEGLGSQDALGAGGRYDNLVKDLGGPEAGAMGFAMGVERILLIQPAEGKPDNLKTHVFIVTMGEKAYQQGFLLLNKLRQEDVSSEMSYTPGSIKSQMRLADKSQAPFVLILGEDELRENSAALKDMRSGAQEKIPFSQIIGVIKNKI